MLLRKAVAGAAPGYTWDEDGAVVEVDDDLALDLLDIPDGGFSVVESPPEEATTEVSEAPAAKRRSRAKDSTAVSAAGLNTPVAE